MISCRPQSLELCTGCTKNELTLPAARLFSIPFRKNVPLLTSPSKIGEMSFDTLSASPAEGHASVAAIYVKIGGLMTLWDKESKFAGLADQGE